MFENVANPICKIVSCKPRFKKSLFMNFDPFSTSIQQVIIPE